MAKKPESMGGGKQSSGPTLRGGQFEGGTRRMSDGSKIHLVNAVRNTLRRGDRPLKPEKVSDEDRVNMPEPEKRPVIDLEETMPGGAATDEEATSKENRDKLALALERIAEYEKRKFTKPETRSDKEYVRPTLDKKTGPAEGESVLDFQKAAYERSEKEYLHKYKDFQKLNALRRKLSKGLNGEKAAELEKLRSDRNIERIKYAEAMEASVRERLAAKGKSEEYITKALEKYRGIIRFNELVRKPQEEEQRARFEALNEKGQSAFNSGLRFAVKIGQVINKPFEMIAGKKGARFLRAAAISAVVTGFAASSAAFGTAGALAILGYGTYRFGRSLASTFTGMATGMGAGFVAEKAAKGRQSKARASLKQLESENRRNHFTYNALSRLDEKQSKLSITASDHTVASSKRKAQILGAIIGGAGVSGLAQLLDIDVSSFGGGFTPEPAPKLDIETPDTTLTPPHEFVPSPHAATEHAATPEPTPQPNVEQPSTAPTPPHEPAPEPAPTHAPKYEYKRYFTQDDLEKAETRFLNERQLQNPGEITSRADIKAFLDHYKQTHQPPVHRVRVAEHAASKTEAPVKEAAAPTHAAPKEAFVSKDAPPLSEPSVQNVEIKTPEQTFTTKPYVAEPAPALDVQEIDTDLKIPETQSFFRSINAPKLNIKIPSFKLRMPSPLDLQHHAESVSRPTTASLNDAELQRVAPAGPFRDGSGTLSRSLQESIQSHKTISMNEAVFTDRSGISNEAQSYLLNRVYESGIGPKTTGESIASYLQRAGEAGQRPVELYRTATGQIVIHQNLPSGPLSDDAFNAQRFVAFEQLKKHPGSTVLLTGRDGKSTWIASLKGGINSEVQAGPDLRPASAALDDRGFFGRLFGGPAKIAPVIDVSKLTRIK